jgi:hypothetical protein
MAGLIYKDLVNLKAQAKVMGILIILYGVIALTSDNTVMLGAMMSVLAAMLPITAMAYDDKAKWDKYAMTMPVSRKDLVLSKYFLGGGFILIAFGLNVAFNIVVGIMAMEDIIPMALMLLGAGLFFMAVTLPLMFKFGVEKGRTAMFILIAAPTVLVLLMSKLNIQMPSEAFLEMLPLILIVIAVFSLVLSTVLSISIYKKKEF